MRIKIEHRRYETYYLQLQGKTVCTHRSHDINKQFTHHLKRERRNEERKKNGGLLGASSDGRGLYMIALPNLNVGGH